jgi:hypothetical protein
VDQDGLVSNAYPPLDRDAARRDRGVIERWRSDVHQSYVSMSAGDDLEVLERFEAETRDDREWAEGYEAESPTRRDRRVVSVRESWSTIEMAGRRRSREHRHTSSA